ncbi:MAG: SPOR domain-containing protein [Acidiferrobacterales bacterium]|nr:SPOR domain-containing protein [Acidiferrobacterales bacterium]
MAQARKKRKSSRSSPSFSVSGHGLGMLLAGMVIGSLATVLWQGMRSNDSDVGSGIRQMIETSRQQAATQEVDQPAAVVAPEPQSTNYDFFTVLPEIEVVVSEDEGAVTPPPVVKKPELKTPAATDTDTSEPVVAETVTPKSSSAYMLQAGSYNKPADAERQKAKLALIGLSSAIQKVTIQGRGDFYRVRLGPYENHARMVDIDERLRQEGIQALRLKISRSG